MSTQTFLAGGLVVSTVTFTLVSSGLVADPSTITLRYRQPGGSVQTVVYPNAFITRVSEGIYSAQFDTTNSAAGDWELVWQGTGSAQAVMTASWTVESLPF